MLSKKNVKLMNEHRKILVYYICSLLHFNRCKLLLKSPNMNDIKYMYVYVGHLYDIKHAETFLIRSAFHQIGLSLVNKEIETVSCVSIH